MKPVFYFLLSALATGTLCADQIVLKNGDRLTGSIIKSDKKSLTLKTEFAGTVEVQWDAITDVKSDGTVFVTLTDGQTVAGTLTTNNGSFTVQTKDTGTVQTDRAKVTGIRDATEQQAYETQIERFRNPRLVDLWAGFVDLGFSQATGNSIISTLTSSANASRITSRDKIAVTFTSIYSKNTVTGNSLLTANAMRGGISYNVNLTPKMYAYGSTDLEFDEFQKLDLRFVPSAGFGYHAIKKDGNVLDLFGGGALNKEFFSTGIRRTSGEAVIGNEFIRKITGRTLLREKLVFYPNLTEQGEYRINFDLSQATTLNKWLAWQLSFSNRYLSNPVQGRKTNDLIITTGFRVTFAR
ncbi:MAG: DUF481 domain-containing protein [Acidobacteria bacterium]|nr:DUF481 domain-containing protein [Acidobacteriota bacterium]